MNKCYLFFLYNKTKYTNFTYLFWHETVRVSDSSSVHHQEFYSLYTQQWYMSYKFVDSFRAGAYAPARKMSETCTVSCQNKFVKLVHITGFIIKKIVTMHGHMNV